MTVKSLNDHEKEIVVRLYEGGKMIKDISSYLNTSTSTVGRVLAEFGLAAPVQRLTEEARQVMSILTQYQISHHDLEDIIKGHLKRLRQTEPEPRSERRQAALFMPLSVYRPAPNASE